jgi:hypothetical protein
VGSEGRQRAGPVGTHRGPGERAERGLADPAATLLRPEFTATVSAGAIRDGTRRGVKLRPGGRLSRAVGRVERAHRVGGGSGRRVVGGGSGRAAGVSRETSPSSSGCGAVRVAAVACGLVCPFKAREPVPKSRTGCGAPAPNASRSWRRFSAATQVETWRCPAGQHARHPPKQGLSEPRRIRLSAERPFSPAAGNQPVRRPAHAADLPGHFARPIRRVPTPTVTSPRVSRWPGGRAPGRWPGPGALGRRRAGIVPRAGRRTSDGHRP